MRINILLITVLTIISLTLTINTTVNAQDISNEITASIDGDFFADMETTSNTDPNNNNNAPAVVLQSNLTCPKCNHTSTEAMPSNSCKYFHKCGGCQETIKTPEGKCCVFCAFSDMICPPTQIHNHKQGK